MMSKEQAMHKAERHFSQLEKLVERAIDEEWRADELEQSTLVPQELLELGLLAVDGFRGGPRERRPSESRSSTRRRCCNVWNTNTSHRYVSIYGPLEILARCVYGTREGQEIEYVPLDACLGLPAGEISYVLEDWLERICLKDAFRESVNLVLVEAVGRARESLGRHGRRTFSADGPAQPLPRSAPSQPDAAAERRKEMNCWWPRPMAKAFPCSPSGGFRRASPCTAHRRGKGEKANQKQMSYVGLPSTAIARFPPLSWTRSWTNCSGSSGPRICRVPSTSMCGRR